ncbi:UNVERIFIED_CONTAM: UDP-glycosyltransferase 86A1 [Sesamum calycinum]|uniref:UDP-glycosyltransferase 86A1 n=1 Tax=Sesamum calycinum TaxID=2727403 RepID=A0AAW2JD64_9LAMI
MEARATLVGPASPRGGSEGVALSFRATPVDGEAAAPFAGEAEGGGVGRREGNGLGGGRGNVDNHINYIPGVHSITTTDLMTYLQDPEAIPVLILMAEKGFEQVRKADFVLCNSMDELELEALSALNQKHPTYAIGPINFYTDFTKTSIAKSLWSESDCTHWLNSKSSGSVLYVSFGSVARCNKEEIGELAHGILLNKGLIVPWCNQNMVLSSPATVDQPTNRKLVVDDWKIGVNLIDEEQVGRKEVASKINMLMRGENSIRMKQSIENVSKKLHDSLDVEGSSNKNFNQFLEDLEDKLYAGSGD